MLKRWIVTAAVVVSLVGAATLRAQNESPRQNPPQALAVSAASDAVGSAVVDEINFTGLRRISPENLETQIQSRPREPLDPVKIAHDVRVLARTGWFETVRADVEEVQNAAGNSQNSKSAVRLTFCVPELPFLTKVEFVGSRFLTRRQIEKLLADKKLTARLGEPVNPLRLDQMRRAIEAALADLGHPLARVQVAETMSAQATEVARFGISDGPRLPVGKISFQGHTGIADDSLRHQMQKINPRAFVSGFRGRDVFTREAFEDDRGRLLAYYENHGYPEARIGTARILEYEARTRDWWRLGRERKSIRLDLVVPVEAGSFYKFGAIEFGPELAAALAADRKLTAVSNTARGQTYSALVAQNLRVACERRVQGHRPRNDDATPRSVEMKFASDAAIRTIAVKLDLSSAPPYIVRRLEFQGIHHFPDRYFRKRIGVKEGAPLDDRALEAGLAQLARTGYFKPIKKENIKIAPDDSQRTVDVSIQIEELGQQRASLLGGRGQFGSTLGIAYTLFNIFDREEMLSSRIEGGPESLQLALGFAKEGFLGSRGSLALSLFNTFLRPRLSGTVKGPFFRQRSEGASADYSYALSAQDTLTASYGLSYSDTSYSPSALAGVNGLTAGDIHARSSSRSFGLGWTRNTGSEQIVLADSVSGGWLGGSENLVRSKAEYAYIFRDRIFKSENAWAFRTMLAGIGSYSGDMPLSSRWYSGDEFVRGLRDGELGPQALVLSGTSTGTAHYSTAPTGANLIGAQNAEYRVRLGAGTEAVGFFDLGSGLLQPSWLGRFRPALVDSTNGILHASTGVELRWTLPGIGVPLRAYYAWNLLRLDRSVLTPSGSLLRMHNRFGAFGWGLGSFF